MGASPIWVVRLPAAPFAHDDRLRRGEFAPREVAGNRRDRRHRRDRKTGRLTTDMH